VRQAYAVRVLDAVKVVLEAAVREHDRVRLIEGSLLTGDCLMAGFIVLEDGRAYAAANWATDATLRAIAAEVADPELRAWLLDQQSSVVGMGMTSVDLRQIAPQFRAVLREAIRSAYHRVSENGFESLIARDANTEGWLGRFNDLVTMLDKCDAGDPAEDFNPHMRALIPDRGGRVGSGWPDA
jgi:hypothetical protein